MPKTKTPLLAANAVGWMALAIAILTNSSYNGFAKNLTGSLSSYSILLASEFVMATLVLVSFGAIPTWRELRKLHWKTWRAAITVAFASAVVGPILWIEGLSRTSATNASLFIGFDIILTIILASLWLGDRFHPRQYLGAFIAVLGVSLTFLLSFGGGLRLELGDLFLLIGTFLFSASNVCFRRELQTCDPRIYLTIRIVTAIVTLSLISPFLQVSMASEILSLPTRLIPSLVCFAVLSRFIAMYCYYTAVDRLPVGTVTLVSSINVVVSIVLSHIITGEALLWQHGASAVLIVIGMLVFEFPGGSLRWRTSKMHLHAPHVRPSLRSWLGHSASPASSSSPRSRSSRS